MRSQSTHNRNGRPEPSDNNSPHPKKRAKPGTARSARKTKAERREELHTAARLSGVWAGGESAAVNGRAPAQAHGRSAASIPDAELSWFLNPWIARGMVNVIVGRKNVGKSSALAWLMAQAQRPVILPGFEESVDLMMLPRWRAHGVNLQDLLILDDQHYSPQLQTALLVNIIRGHRADLLVIENLDSYLPGDASENDSQAVRPYLEALHTIACQSGVALVGTRHPGKSADNLCRGSQAWENVPRITLVMEREEGPPLRYWLWSHRCGVSSPPDPVGYTLPRVGGGAPVFTLARQIDSESLRLAQEAPDPTDRVRLEMAMGLLETLLREDWVEARVVFSEAEKERLGEGTVRRAARLMGVQMRREGSGLNHKSFWGRAGLDRPWGEGDAPA